MDKVELIEYTQVSHTSVSKDVSNFNADDSNREIKLADSQAIVTSLASFPLKTAINRVDRNIRDIDMSDINERNVDIDEGAMGITKDTDSSDEVVDKTVEVTTVSDSDNVSPNLENPPQKMAIGVNPNQDLVTQSTTSKARISHHTTDLPLIDPKVNSSQNVQLNTSSTPSFQAPQLGSNATTIVSSTPSMGWGMDRGSAMSAREGSQSSGHSSPPVSQTLSASTPTQPPTPVRTSPTHSAIQVTTPSSSQSSSQSSDPSIAIGPVNEAVSPSTTQFDPRSDRADNNETQPRYYYKTYPIPKVTSSTHNAISEIADTSKTTISHSPTPSIANSNGTSIATTPSIDAHRDGNKSSGGRRGNKNRNRDRDNPRKSNRNRNDRKNKNEVAKGETTTVHSSVTSSENVGNTVLPGRPTSTPVISLPHPYYEPNNRPGNKSITITPLVTMATSTLGASQTGIGSVDGKALDNNNTMGAGIGLIIAGICIFWLLLIPLLCIVCRLKMRAKKKGGGRGKEGRGEASDDMGAMLVEEMIRLELSKGRGKKYQTDVSDVMEIQPLPVTCHGDYENLPNQNPAHIQSDIILANQSSILPDMNLAQYANVHGELYDSIEQHKRITLPLESRLCDNALRSPQGHHTMDSSNIYSELDEGRDTIASISSPILSRDHSHLTSFTGYRSNQSVSVDSGFDNRCSIKHDNSNLSMADKSCLDIHDSFIVPDKPVYKGYTPVQLDSSVEQSLDSSPAFSGYANIRQLRREHESAGSLTNDTNSVDSSSFNEHDKLTSTPSDKLPFDSHTKPEAHKAVHQIIDPSKYLICNNHIGSLEKTGNPRNSQHSGECRCAFRSEATNTNESCPCQTPSSEQKDFPGQQSTEKTLATKNLHGELVYPTSKNTLV